MLVKRRLAEFRPNGLEGAAFEAFDVTPFDTLLVRCCCLFLAAFDCLSLSRANSSSYRVMLVLFESGSTILPFRHASSVSSFAFRRHCSEQTNLAGSTGVFGNSWTTMLVWDVDTLSVSYQQKVLAAGLHFTQQSPACVPRQKELSVVDARVARHRVTTALRARRFSCMATRIIRAWRLPS